MKLTTNSGQSTAPLRFLIELLATLRIAQPIDCMKYLDQSEDLPEQPILNADQAGAFSVFRPQRHFYSGVQMDAAVDQNSSPSPGIASGGTYQFLVAACSVN
ncbi:hypothetical protein E4U54_000634 [Claviceps lovelessii]|nr:hypothetical protein E4U54_000634 [Claviceps lovelessii]